MLFTKLKATTAVVLMLGFVATILTSRTSAGQEEKPPAFAADEKPKPNALTPKEIADGWILLFDGETIFGWKTGGAVEVNGGALVIGGDNKVATAMPTTKFAEYDLILETDGNGSVAFKEARREGSVGLSGGPQTTTIAVRIDPKQVGTETKVVEGPDKTVHYAISAFNTGRAEFRIDAPSTGTLRVKSVKLRPLATNPLFTGKNLDGWKVNAADPKRMASKWDATKDGELSLKNGPGDLFSEKQFDNFVLQLECKTLGKYLNSGVFFRCIPEQYQNGYEAQIQNAYLGDDRAKPIDYGTGAIYRRVAARKVVSNDNEWFAMTVVADGKHIATWVNGHQTVDWTDDRPAADNPRKGYRAAKGHFSIQGHDPTTDLLFRNIRIAELGTE